jgi:hypothetical protein
MGNIAALTPGTNRVDSPDEGYGRSFFLVCGWMAAPDGGSAGQCHRAAAAFSEARWMEGGLNHGRATIRGG